MVTETKKIAGAITNIDIDKLIYNMAKGIADGQFRLDQTCMELATAGSLIKTKLF